ncbi:MAG: hypothetical protein ABI171_18830 [Collimonas sp.]|uniref:hypothetical protein n=1 Tax=Collimonas sp. TaxID=1963772 RepID=UPI003266A4FF
MTSQRAQTELGIAFAIGNLTEFDQQQVRIMMRMLSTRLCTPFLVSNARDGEIVLVANAAEAGAFILRAKRQAEIREIRLPRPLRLMQLANGLDAMIPFIHPAALVSATPHKPCSRLSGALGSSPSAILCLTGAWGRCWLVPHSDDVMFDCPLEHVAIALATSDVIFKTETLGSIDVEHDAKLRLRRDEVLWLSKPDPDLERIITVKLRQPDAFLKLQIWPNLARMPTHAPWTTVFAAMQDGIAADDAMHLAIEAGIQEADAHVGFCVLLQQRYATLSVQAHSPHPAQTIRAATENSFLQRIKGRLLHMLASA